VAAAASTVHEASAHDSAHFTPAEVDLTGAYGGGLDCEAPATRPSWVRRTRATFGNSVWAPVALKLLGLALGMLALAAVGIASILSGVGGVPVPLSNLLGSDIHAAWLASKSAASGRTGAGASAPQPAAAPAASSAPSAASGGKGIDTDTAANASVSAVGTATQAGAASAAGPSTASSGMTEDGKVILNLASVEELRHLPGVGPKRADAIVALRTRLGRFKHVNDLMRVKGIGVRGLKKLLPHLVLDAPKPSVAPL
jgi:competence protein ComEA